ncbi:glycosyltransferase, partial [Burkholderia pseudomallei]
IPPLEAMHCGCPVIASNAACMPEILGDAALFFDPHSAEALASQIRLLFNDDGLRRELSDRGVQRAGHYSWDRGANDLIQACRDAAA